LPWRWCRLQCCGGSGFGCCADPRRHPRALAHQFPMHPLSHRRRHCRCRGCRSQTLRLVLAQTTMTGECRQLIRSDLGVGGGLGQEVGAGIGQQGRWRWAPCAASPLRGLRRWGHRINVTGWFGHGAGGWRRAVTPNSKQIKLRFGRARSSVAPGNH